MLADFCFAFVKKFLVDVFKQAANDHEQLIFCFLFLEAEIKFTFFVLLGLITNSKFVTVSVILALK